MKITKQEKEKVLYRTLYSGDIFKYENRFYIVTNEEILSNDVSVNAICLESGDFEFFCDSDLVEMIDYEFIVK